MIPKEIKLEKGKKVGLIRYLLEKFERFDSDYQTELVIIQGQSKKINFQLDRFHSDSNFVTITKRKL